MRQRPSKMKRPTEIAVWCPIPLRTGRDMARLVEVAAMVQAARQLGHDSADDFNKKLIKKMIGEG